MVVKLQFEFMGRKLTRHLLTLNAMVSLKTGVRLWGITFIVKRETTQTIS